AWSSLLPASDPLCAKTGGFRAVIQSSRSWLDLAPAATPLDEASNMSALVRWSAERVCLEAVELEADSFVVGDDALPTRVVATFGPKPAAARLGSVQGTQLFQPLTCALR
ncbi:MAG TPA: hypothetical protein VNG33_11470, partial [Polyangiaceae bacterium]|nr:hypothetical protein [Polyangiaceae bacterium]